MKGEEVHHPNHSFTLFESFGQAFPKACRVLGQSPEPTSADVGIPLYAGKALRRARIPFMIDLVSHKSIKQTKEKHRRGVACCSRLLVYGHIVLQKPISLRSIPPYRLAVPVIREHQGTPLR